MNQAHAARLYFLFALLLLGIAWKICQSATAQLEHAQAVQAAKVERILSEN